MHDPHDAPPPVTPKRPSAVLLVAAVIAVGALVTAGALPKLRERTARAEAAAAADGPKAVVTAKVTAAKATAEVALPATARAAESAIVYAKTTGYVGAVLVDLGSSVKAGDLLASVEVPEREEELRVARAKLDEAQKNEKLAAVRADRFAGLADSGVVTPQEAETYALARNSQVGAVESNAAELRRLATLRGYQRVTAPFDGTVVRRLVDRGALVGSGVNPLFEIGRVDTLKLLVDIPQGFAAAVKRAPNGPAKVSVRGGATVEGKLVRVADALDLDNHTLRAEVQIPGDKGILAGMFAMVTVPVTRERPPIVLPSAALVIRKEGPQVWIFEGGKVTPRPVTLVRDLGKDVEVDAAVDGAPGGLRPGETVVLHPPDDLTPGATVTEAPPPAASAPR